MNQLNKRRLLRLLIAVAVSLIATQMLFALILMFLPLQVSAQYVAEGREWIGLTLFPIVFATAYLLLSRGNKQ